jgi:hypothetical protein
MPLPVTDPACGAGDLLLAAARRLPVFGSATETLEQWGRQLYGTDVVQEFIDAARLRLTLMAMERTNDTVDLPLAARLLSNIKAGDGFDSLMPQSVSGLLFINPPFGSTSEFRHHFNGNGRVSRAGLFVDRALKALAPGAWLVAILPDVLRSGSSYYSLRQRISGQLDNVRVLLEGRFDTATDVDVFVLVGRRTFKPTANREIDWFQVPRSAGNGRLADAFLLGVGPIVEYRDRAREKQRTYLKVGGMRPWTVQSRIANQWPAGDRLTYPPFVAIRRTSSPHDSRRVVASVVTGKRPVAVENHIITAQPRSRRLQDAIALMQWLSSSTVTEHLQRRIRCRHLTIRALSELPWPT